MLDSGQVRNGHVMALMHYVRVANKSRDRISVVDLHYDHPFEVIGRQLIEDCFSADVFSSQKNSTKTQIAEKLVNAGQKPFTVHFIKQDGSPRTLRGRLLEPEPMMGRPRVEDLDEPNQKKRLKQVDHRTIKWLVLDNVKYVVK